MGAERHTYRQVNLGIGQKDMYRQTSNQVLRVLGTRAEKHLETERLTVDTGTVSHIL